MSEIACLKDFQSAIHTSAQNEEKRSLLEDSKDYLKLNGVHWVEEFETCHIPNLPALLVSNHYLRPILGRLISNKGDFLSNLYSTREATIVTALATIALSRVSDRKTVWMVKGDLKANTPDQQFQLDTISVYDNLPVVENPTNSEGREFVKRIRAVFSSGLNLGIFPEGRVSKKGNIFGSISGEADENFKGVFSVCKKSNYQILPMGICFEKGRFIVRSGSVIKASEDAADSDDIATEVMHAISTLLSRNLS